MKYFLVAVIFTTIAGCGSSGWKLNREIKLTDITPLGLVADNRGLWVSDVTGNRVVLLDFNGKILTVVDNLERPMHIALHHDTIYVPEYTNDSITAIGQYGVVPIPIAEMLDGPAGIAADDNTLAIADFYNNRILLKKNDRLYRLGKEGHNAGELYYPTDVAFYHGKIYVADAYNNRVQVFDEAGQSLQIIGDGDGIQVATGITVDEQSVFVTDFEGNRILIYDLEGALRYILYDSLNKPTDLVVYQNKLYVANYGGNSIVEFIRD